MELKINKEKFNKKHVQTKALYIRHLELEFWRELQQICNTEKCNIANAVRWALKRSLGKA